MDTLYKEINEIPEIDLYNKLFNVTSGYSDIQDYYMECRECRQLTGIGEVIFKIIKNYNDHKHKLHDKSNNNNYCRYFMYWLYNEKSSYRVIRGDHDAKWNDCISCVWNKLEKTITVPYKKCTFENDIKSFAIVQIRKILDDVCLIENKKNLISYMSDRDKCLNFNKLKHDYLHSILKQMSSIPDNILWKKKNFNFVDGCSIEKALDFLQEKQCPPDETIRCPEPKACITVPPKTQEDCTKNSCPNLEQLCKYEYPPTECDCKDQVIKIDCQEQTPDILKQSCPSFCTETLHYISPTTKEQQGKSHNIPHLQVPVTVLSSVVGTIFFFVLLYKV
ncbi:hypothetical protein PVC01_060005100 [Plasmodium vivax]|uniref:VIR protein n=1 Tax=Plasmodium vivax TaxID=5855 RepID=A0A1G4H9D2_PLAVI|nr:hypothetical protein PVC01_060005100 [Plasmodium vivax]